MFSYNTRKPAALLIAALLCLFPVTNLVQAASDGVEGATTPRASETGLPLPRFVSLRAGRVNLRTGPGVQYPIEWVYQRRNLPLEVVDEFETWRQVRDWEGTLGWVHQTMIQGKRTVMVTVPEVILRQGPNEAEPGVARLQEAVITSLKACKTGWCQVEIDGLKGWLPNNAIFGLNAGEIRN